MCSIHTLRQRLTFCFYVLSLCFVAAVQNTRAAEPTDPDSELASFQIASGFDVNLFASETDGVIKPIQIRFDPQGRIWVIGSSVYPQLEPGQIPNDKVLVLEDTDHNGKCDKVTVFADGLMIPTGIELGDGGVYIGQGTELLFFKDNDGDLKADERRVVLRGFGTGDNHQNINSFMWGPGGELWFCQGLHTHSNVETPWGIVRMNQAGLWRFRPRLKKLEGFYGSAYEPQNPWGYVFTEWGEPIVIAGNNSSPIYPVPGLTSRHLDLAPTIIWKNGQGRKSSGADIVGTAHFPDDWQGTLITGGYINNAVWALRIIEDGSGFALEDREPLIKSTSRNFRPVDVKFGPDGALYICDWFNPIIGHYQASFRHPDRDKTHGRIWRVTARGRPLTDRPQLAKASIPELLDALESSDRWTWQFAKRVLVDRNDPAIVTAVQKWARDEKRSEPGLKEALGVLESYEAADDELVRKLATDAVDPGARAYAASAVGRWADRLHDPVSILQTLANDENARVRLHTIVAATYLNDPRALDVIATAIQRPTDKFIDYAFTQAVYALNALERVKTLVSDESTDYSRRLALWQILIRNGGSRDLQDVFLVRDEQLRRRLGPLMLEAIRSRNVTPDFHSTEFLGRFVQEKDPVAIRLAGLWKLEKFGPNLENIAADSSQPAEVRSAAIDALANLKTASGKAVVLNLAKANAPELKTPAIVALVSLDMNAAASLVSDPAGEPRDAQSWRAIFAAFLQRHGGAAALAKAFESRPPSAEVASIALGVMNESGRRSEELANALSPKAQQKLTLADVPTLVSEVRSKGDSVRGEQILKRPELGCITCHAVKGQGGKIGPDLGALGTAQPIDFIIGATLDPQKEVKEGYNVTAVTTKDGDDFQGYSIREDGREIVLRDILQNSTVTIEKAKIAQKKQVGSPMPAGLADSMTRQEFLDLVKYLSELGK